MRPDTPAENVDHTAEAARLERTAGLYPEDAEALLLRAAAHLELSGDRPTASTLYDRLLSSTADLDNPHLVRALKASNLWEYGHEAEARRSSRASARRPPRTRPPGSSWRKPSNPTTNWKRPTRPTRRPCTAS
ncbi:hypothetical protein GCM10011428_36030 [Streptomyces violaceus]